MENRRCKYQGEPSDPDCMECDGTSSCCEPVHNAMQFFCPMANVPTSTHQMKKVRAVNGKPQFYEPFEVQKARAKLLSAVCRHMPPEPFKGGVALLVKWCFPIKGKHKDGEYRTSKPDTDNLQKLLKDVMSGCGFWYDDAQVCREIVEKFWAAMPGIFISVEAIE